MPSSGPGYNVSRKRSSISASLPANPSKRRKPSSGPSGLRQTSFPPEESGRVEPCRSPSVDSTFTANTNTTKKRGRKPRAGGDDARSTAGTSARGSKAGASDGADKADEEEEAEQDDGGEALDAVLEGQGEADEKQEKEHLRMLVDRLDPDQADRYAKYRAVKLKKETVRRITNQTLSQSVPQSVVTTINSYTKVFIGSLIERARTVQQEWQAVAEYAPIDDPRLPAHAQPPTASPSPLPASPSPPLQQSPEPLPLPSATTQTSNRQRNPYGYQHLRPPREPNSYCSSRAAPPPRTNRSPDTSQEDAGGAASGDDDTATYLANDGNDGVDKRILADAPLRDRLAERDRGPLTPDHFREALRRYKKDREGGAMGFLGLSLEGRERTAGRMGGRRLFR